MGKSFPQAGAEHPQASEMPPLGVEAPASPIILGPLKGSRFIFDAVNYGVIIVNSGARPDEKKDLP